MCAVAVMRVVNVKTNIHVTQPTRAGRDAAVRENICNFNGLRAVRGEWLKTKIT